VADEQARERAIDAVSRAAPTLLAAAGRRAGEKPLDWWRRAFALTFSAELRAERKGRGASFVDRDRPRFIRFTEPAAAAIDRVPRSSWRRRRIEGKLLSVARLAKASATFAGGRAQRSPAVRTILPGRSTGMPALKSSSSHGSSGTRCLRLSASCRG
jgi:hypothetical protein